MSKTTNAYSYSRISTYLKCPHRFKLAYIDKISVPTSLVLLKGRIAHEILSEYAKQCYNLKRTSLWEEKEDLYNKILGNYTEVDNKTRSEIIGVVDNWISGNEILLDGLAGVEEKIAVNKEFEEVEWFDDEVFFRAIIDMLYLQDDKCKIIDYKSGFVTYKDDLQLEIYAWIVKKLYPQIEKIQIEFDFIRHDYQDYANIEIEDIEKIEDKILKIVNTIETDKKFKPKISSECINCAFSGYCEEIQKTKNDYMKMEKEELLIEGIKLEKKLKEIKDLLKEYAKIERIIASDLVAEYQTKQSINWDVPMLIEKCNESGFNILPFLRVDKRQMKSKEDEIKEFANDCFEEKTELKFYMGKIKEENEKRK